MEQNKVQITWRGTEASEALGERIQHLATDLEEVFDRIVSCRVVVEAPNKHHRSGGHFHVKVELAVPGRQLVVTRDPPDRNGEDAFAAVNEAFGSMRRQLEEYSRERRGEVKRHTRAAEF